MAWSIAVHGTEAQERIPFGLVLSEDLALRVVADVANLAEAANIKLCGAELGHDGGSGAVRGGEMTMCGES